MTIAFAIILTVVLLGGTIATLLIWEAFPKPHTTTDTTPDPTTKESGGGKRSYTKWLTVGIVTLIVAIAIVIYWAIDGNSIFQDISINALPEYLWLWVVTALVAGAAIIGWLGKGGGGPKAIGRGVMGIMFLVTLGFTIGFLIYGDQLFVVYDDWRQERTASFYGDGEGAGNVPAVEVLFVDVIVPAGGSAELKQERRCYVDNIQNNQQDITREVSHNVLKFTSKHPKDLSVRVWMFDIPRLTCATSFKTLSAQGKFL